MPHPTPSNDVRLLLLCAGDPDGDRPFSGSARGLFTALERRGCVHAKANVLGMTDPFSPGSKPMQWARRLDRFGIEAAYRWSELSWQRNTDRAHEAAARNPGFNAVLMYGTTFHPTLDAPMYCYMDATSAQVASTGAWEFARFSEAKKQRVIDYQRDIFRDCAAVFPRSRWTARSVLQDYAIPQDRVVVAGAGPNYRIHPLPHGDYAAQRILFVGGEFERKGGPLIVEAFRLVRERLPQATLRIVGCDPDIREPGIEIAGRIDRKAEGGQESLLAEFAAASVFCIMSHYEPFGIVVLEAQHCGVPCVAPARFAFPEIIRDGETGVVLPEYDVVSLANTLAGLLENPARLETMGAAGREWVEREWTWDAAAARIEARVRADLAARAGS
jgi:glycosyltransferase involved in cell wall biosynthesis